MVGNAFQFLFAGFDTISTGIHFMAFELALNQDIQQRLFEEIKELDELLEGKSPTYENLQKMEYLDKVVSESLRKWPPAGVQDRKCTKSFVITDNNGAQVLLEPGQIILTPAYAIMHDPQYYPNPDKFDPERFSIENRKNINEFTYLPFGLGPR
jgi:cytochrome P450 family 9